MGLTITTEVWVPRVNFAFRKGHLVLERELIIYTKLVGIIELVNVREQLREIKQFSRQV